MAKLSDLVMGKAGGKYFTPDSIEKQTVMILEDIKPDTDVREHDTGKEFEDRGKKKKQKYYCILITDGKAQKDLHITWFGLKQLSEVLPKNESWQGYQFVIDVVKKQGKLEIRVIGKVAPGTFFPPQSGIVDSSGKLLGMVKACTNGTMSDDEFWKNAALITGSIPASMELVKKLKDEGKVTQNSDKTWKVT